jgi:hypothetical protein
MPFISSITAMLGDIFINVGNVYGTSSLEVTLRADSNGAPGAVIEIFNVTSAPDALNGVPFPPLVLQSSLHPVLNAGQMYWLSATANEPGGEFGWWFNSIGDSGQVSLENSGVPGSAINTPGVFELTSAVPEPACFIYAASGIIAMFFRRSLTVRRDHSSRLS